MRRTKKLLAAEKTIRQLSDGNRGLIKRNMGHEDMYHLLEGQGYSWDSNSGTWSKFEKPDNAISTGVIDIRLRAHLGDVEQATKFIGEALQKAGFKFVRVSPPDPDDRNGPAVTARVYMSGVLPDQDAGK